MANVKNSAVINRREFVKSAGVAAAGMTVTAGLGQTTQASERPNILLLLVDQWRERCWFPEDCRIPAIERLQKQGLSFTNHFTCAVPCSPSRATIFTGLHLPQHNVRVNVGAISDRSGGPGLDPGITTLGHIFKRSGYRTPYFGKWHLTEPSKHKKTGLSAYGFEEWKGPDRDGAPLEGLMVDQKFVSHAISWLEHNGGNGPWFLTCSLINPHDIAWYSRFDLPPVIVPDVCDRLPDNWNDTLEGKPRIQTEFQRKYGRALGTGPNQPEHVWRHYLDFYCYLTRKVDMQIDRILTALEKLGLDDNTIVIFTSDHGEMCGSHKLQGKGPFIYQENIHVPLVIKWPHRIIPGSETSALTHSVDLMPTILDLAGIPANTDHLPGKSMVPLIQDLVKIDLHDHVLLAYGPTLAAYLSKKWGLPPVPYATNLRGIFDGRYKFARYFDIGQEEEYELYDLYNDPLEMWNLAADPGYRSTKKHMADLLGEAEKEER
jgi:arylsulfatase